MSLTALLPLFLTLLVGLGFTFYVLQRKALAQAICLQQASLLQQNLKRTLTDLIHLNPHAERLREQRTKAENALKAALESGAPPAIAAAQAALTAVILQQVALHARQTGLLAEAQRLRDESQREVRRRTASLAVTEFQAPQFYTRALAVEERPAATLTPNYQPIARFSEGQQQRYSYRVELARGFPLPWASPDTKQKTECSVTLESEEDNQWAVRVLAVKSS